jgi:hypothetical protein
MRVCSDPWATYLGGHAGGLPGADRGPVDDVLQHSQVFVGPAELLPGGTDTVLEAARLQQ